MPITFAVNIVRLEVYMTIASPMTLTFILGHECVSNMTIFSTCNIPDNAFKLGMTGDLCVAFAELDRDFV